jgi:hypothetical protein
MSVNKIGMDPVQPYGTGRPASAADAEGKPTQRAQRPAGRTRTDQVGLSAEGLSMAARLAEVEARVAQDYYADPTVADEVARRLLASGDLGS